ncbi:hypothetical protein [Rubellimicrobium aerolatum]|uniref:Type II toxin-antitoxin system ParD family antitoxin n=1 Tax=Rubellimicrobium aerolatum TaxID=490979 RepID=A0ABW0S8Q2_9RHOB|nr:hypothetical protein [Rubellimicrobium aerolatum]MBP1804665.1 Arc/MetJ-type ribon-helix-helix transcriptional regulator [Rubellimicrobium aerolatum]
MSVEVNADDGLAPVQVTLDVPGRLARDYAELVRVGVYLSIEEAIREALVAGWRFNRGPHHTIRLDWSRDPEEPSEDLPDQADQADAAEKA